MKKTLAKLTVWRKSKTSAALGYIIDTILRERQDMEFQYEGSPVQSRQDLPGKQPLYLSKHNIQCQIIQNKAVINFTLKEVK